MTPWTVARQSPLSIRFPGQEYWNGLPFPSPGDLPDAGIKSVSSALAGKFFSAEPPEKPYFWNKNIFSPVLMPGTFGMVLKNFQRCTITSTFSSVQFSHSVMSNSLWPHGLQHTRPPWTSPSAGVSPNPYPWNWWCHPTISSSVVPFSCLQSFPASGSFPMSQFFTLSGQRIGVSSSASVVPMNIQDWFPLGGTSWISLLSKGLSKVFSNTTVQKH